MWREEKPQAERPLAEALRLQNKAAELGFDWPDLAPLWDKLNEELGEFQEAVASGNPSLIRDEMGDLLFMLVNFSRFLDVSAEEALHGVNEKFVRRLRFVEAQLQKAGQQWQHTDLEQLEAWWQQAKVESAAQQD